MTNDLDRRNVNYYDALFAGNPTHVIEKLPYDQTLFGNANIGNQVFTNINVPFTENPRSSSLMIMNIYARTTLPFETPEVKTFLNWTTVNICIGEFRLVTCSLYDLFHRHEGYCMGNFEGRHTDPTVKADRDRIAVLGLASDLYDAVEDPSVKHTLYKESFDPVVAERWKKIARAAMDKILHGGQPLYVAPRQGLHVNVTTYAPGLDALKNALRGYKGSPDNWPGLWVHLEGRETSEAAQGR